MADAKQHRDYALKFGTDVIAFVPGSLRQYNAGRRDEVRSGAAYHPYKQEMIGKRPALEFTIIDASLVTAWQKVGAGETITAISAFWRAAEQFAGLSGAFVSSAMALGVVMPVSIQAGPNEHAKLQCLALAAYSGGDAFTDGVATATEPAAMFDTWYPTSVVIGSDTILKINSMSGQWAYNIMDDQQLEPAYYVYDGFDFTGSAQVLDVSLASLARIEDTTEESVTLNLTSKLDDSTLAIPFGLCSIQAERGGGQATINWQKLMPRS